MINEQETFTLNVTVRNCTTHNLRNAELIAAATTFASVVGSNVAVLGDMTAGQAQVTAFQCQAIVQTPTPTGPADPLINLSVRAVLDFRGFKSQPVLGEISPD